MALSQPQKIRSVAQYRRMSTDDQKNSILNQADAIAKYAAAHSMQIVETYDDEGKSGVQISTRHELKRLLADVMQSEKAFDAVLVYDCSRWGRFQDMDQAAYYEFHCRLNGVQVIYIAEAFADDGSPLAPMMKVMSRYAAAKYSQDLSVRCKAGQTRIVKAGYAMGGPVPLGLRKLVVNALGEPRMLLEVGERKGLQSHHIRLVPGPPHEIALVNRIFKMYANTSTSFKEIAKRLNQEKLKNHHGRPFTPALICKLLHQESYIGNNVWAKTAGVLGETRRWRLPPDQWIRKDASFEPIVDKALFERVQKKMNRRIYSAVTPEKLLHDLRDGLKRGKRYTTDELKQNGCCTNHVYAKFFGGLPQAYALLGHVVTKDRQNERKVATRSRNVAIKRSVAASLAEAGCKVQYTVKSDLLTVNDCWRVGLNVAVLSDRAPGDTWRVSAPKGEFHLYLIVRPASDRSIKDYFLVPPTKISLIPGNLRAKNSPAVDALRVRDLTPLAAFLS